MARSIRHFYAIEENYPNNYVHVFNSKADRNAWVAEKPTHREETTPTDPRVKRTIMDSSPHMTIPEPGHYRYRMTNPTHYIAMAGLSGYIPNYTGACETSRGAIESLCSLHDLSENGRVARELRKYGFSYLPKDAGNEYASVESCDCSEPWDHDEADTPDNWPDYPQPENKH